MEQEKVPLSMAAQYLVEECRMVLPGIQALFGFISKSIFIPMLATGIFAFIIVLWFVLPRVQKKNHGAWV